MSIATKIQEIQNELQPIGVSLVAISKTKNIDEILEAYHAGQRHFGENLVQEMIMKQEQLPDDISWHMVGHLQSNKVKYIAPFISLIHSVDSLKLLKEINKHAKRHNRIIDCLLQVDISMEETKFGLDHIELITLLEDNDYLGLENIRICGLMGIATNTDNEKEIREDFYELRTLFDGIKASYFRNNDSFQTLSMGMSSDYKIAIEKGSNMVRLGSTIFGKRIIKHYKSK